ncbi:MAG: threonine--tRNA ligase [Candidatus Peregrinibacteria bacterium]
MSKNNKKVDLDAMRHSCSHVLAQAVMEMFPEVKLAIGPNIEDGFYYDFDLPRTLIPEDLVILEKKMKQIIKQDQRFVKRVDDGKKALEFLKKTKQDYKIEMAKEYLAEGQEISFYENVMPDGTPKFVDMCEGPHIERTGQIVAFKLLKIAGAYWRGDEKNKMLQRIYGTCFASREELDDYLRMIEEAKKRDHRRLGEDLDLFNTYEEAGAGLVYWHPNGGRIRSIIEDFWKKEHFKNGYELVNSPHIGKSWLWETSGHLEFFKENMYSPMKIDEDEYYLKPMNCPFHIMMYNHRIHSYRDLPLRWAELGTVYRYEPSGVLHGLLRVRGFTQDDAHIFCTPDQIEDEILETLKFSLFMWKKFGFGKVKAYLSTRPEKATGEQKRWDQATKSLEKAIKAEKLEYEVDEGGGAFYGPKIDLKVKDAIGREWQMTTIQFDFNLPERFNMTFVDKDGKEHRPYMVHRALLGSLERFFGVLTEHYAGAFPVWMAPVQALILPVSEKFDKYAEEVAKVLRESEVRVDVDRSGEQLGKKIRNAEMKKVPYMLVVGEKEKKDKTVAVRDYATKKQAVMRLEKFVKMVLQ